MKRACLPQFCCSPPPPKAKGATQGISSAARSESSGLLGILNVIRQPSVA
jgi:hypothetical protein